MALPVRLNFRPNVIVVFCIVVILYFWIIFSGNDPNNSLTTRRQFIDMKHLLIASVIAAEKGGREVRKARETPLEIHLKGKTLEGAPDVVTQADKKSNMVMVDTLSYTFPGLKIVSEESTTDSERLVEPLIIGPTLLGEAQFANIPDDIQLSIDDLTVWIDPLDATKEYSEGLTQYVTTMVCVASRGKPILGVIHQPFLGRTFWATRFGIDKKLLKLRSTFQKPNNGSLRLIVSRSHKGSVVDFAKKSFGDNFRLVESAGSGFKTLELFHGNADVYVHTTHIKKWDICAPHALIKYGSEGDLYTLTGSPIDYSAESPALNPNGVFAAVKSEFLKLHDHIQWPK